MKTFEMTEEQLNKIKEACRPVPLIALNCGMPSSPQENVNDAWKSLGEELGFDYLTVRPISGKGPKFFEAKEKP